MLLQGDGPVIAPVFSPRSGLVLSRELARIGHRAPLHVVAISPAAAAALPPHNLTIADHPDAAAMAQAVIRCLLPLTPP